MTQEKIEWEEDEVIVEYDDDADVIKLEIGEAIEGTLVDKWDSKRYAGRKMYRIKVKGDEKEKIIPGTTVLDSRMANKEIGEEVRIVRESNVPSDKGNPTQIYKTFHKKSGEADEQTYD